MGKPPVAFLEIRALAHATENPEKVCKALEAIAPQEVLGEMEASRQSLEGHYGNPIILITLRTRKRALAGKILVNLFQRLSKPDRSLLLASLDGRIDEGGNLYLRLDKQEAYLGRVKLGEADPLRVKVKLSIPAKQREKLLEACKKLLEGCLDP
ncbi:MAG: RNA-binding domain-containing protein [Candidatus Hecatellaceae archaeon]